MYLFVVAPPLSVDAVMAVFKEVAWNWRKFGRLLDIPQAALNVIEIDFSADLDRLRGLMVYWVLKCPYASWRYLIWRLDSGAGKHYVQVADSCRDFTEKITGTYMWAYSCWE